MHALTLILFTVLLVLYYRHGTEHNWFVRIIGSAIIAAVFTVVIIVALMLLLATLGVLL